MTVPRPIRYTLAFAAFAAISTHADARPKKQDLPEAHISLESLGFPGFSSRLIAEGASTLTVNFADDKHLLVTYGTRGLVTRHEGEQHIDQDRMVAALLVDIPSGQVVARTEWLLHDHGRYLWPLGHGRFLLRIENGLSTFAPAANLKSGRAFDRTVFAVVPGTVDAVLVASDEQLVLVNSSTQVKRPVVTVQPAPPPTHPRFAADAHQLPPRISSNAAAPEPEDTKSAELLSFFRISGEGTPQDPLEVVPAGTSFASSIVALPVFSDGYLQPVAQGSTQWHVVFHPFSGKNIPLAPIDTSCAPNMSRVGPAQFVALACRGLAGNVMLIAYDLAQHEIWDEPLPQSDVPAVYAVAGSVGRFAISRITTSTTGADSTAQITTNQDLRLYQTQTGDLLFHAALSPAFKTGENFDLTFDGMHLAIVNGMTIEVYRLPELTKQDKEDLADLEKLRPPSSSARITFGASAEAPVSQATIIEAPADTTSPANPPNIVVLGDTNRPAQPPSLLTDGEKAEYTNKPEKKPQ